ncbi:hypothetical protein NLG97_g1266 [Lecanicillium saksenae]|uniref:Uncharacterized protein n=1 Tax=Lecanicillium saksenae TaxID=468837 RepID=A0ACC1R480_9HYPO|nr:hypothetical protein NLG97_g1266 [Lecanicillium saksenae]
MRTFATLKEAESLLNREFYYAGHTSVYARHVDTSHPLHSLWERVRNRIRDIYGVSDNRSNSTIRAKIDNLAMSICSSARNAVESYKAALDGDRAGYDISRTQLPRKADVLALRFSSQGWSFKKDVMQLLAECNSLHLLQVLDGPSSRAVRATSDNDRNTQTIVDHAPSPIEELHGQRNIGRMEQAIQELRDRVEQTEDTCRRLQDAAALAAQTELGDENGDRAIAINRKLEKLNNSYPKLSDRTELVDAAEVVATLLQAAAAGEQMTKEHPLQLPGMPVDEQESTSGTLFSKRYDLPDDVIAHRKTLFGGVLSDNNPSPKKRGPGLEEAKPSKRMKTQSLRSPSHSNTRH